MKYWGVFSLAILALVSNSFGDVPEESEENKYVKIFYTKPFKKLAKSVKDMKPHVIFSGGGGKGNGVARVDVGGTVFKKGGTRVDGTGFIQKSFVEGFPSLDSYGVGATLFHDLGNKMNAFVGVQKQFNTLDKYYFSSGIQFKP